MSLTVVITVTFVVVYFGVTLFLCRGVKLSTREICLCGLCIAMSLVLESFRIPLPTSATVPFASMVPLMMLSIVDQPRVAFLSGWVCGILAMFFVPAWQPVHWGQIFVEQLVCFSCLGYAGIFGSDKRWKMLCGIVLASVLRFCGHLLSGVVFFSQNAWDGWGAWGYSFGYNLSQNLPLILMSAVIVLALPLKTLGRMVKRSA